MPGNTFEYAETPDGKTAVHCGTLHLLDEGDRVSWDLNDATVSVSWEECDLSGRVPEGTTAIFGYMELVNGSAQAIINVRDAASAEGNSDILQMLHHGLHVDDTLGSPVIMKATNGIFDYKAYDVVSGVERIVFGLWGYFI